MQPQDEVALHGFLDGVDSVHIVTACGADAIAAAAILAKALRRAGRHVTGITTVSFAERVDSPASRAWLGDAPALLVVGLGTPPPLSPSVPQLCIDDRSDEPLPARALRLAETLAHLADATWLAAVGLIGRHEPHALPHFLVQRALARHTHADLEEIAALVDVAARGPEPASESLMAVEMLAASPDPRRFLASVPAELLRKTQELVRVELARAVKLRPRPGFGVVVVEYESRCHLEDLVADRWRGLRPGTVVLVGNHGCVDGRIAVVAKCAVSEALDRLRSTIGDEGATLLDPETWSTLLRRLGVPAAAIERVDGVAFEAGALLN